MRDKNTEDLDLLMDCVSNVFLIDKDRIFSKSRFKEVCYARHAFFRLARALTSKTLQEIGGYTDRHHASVMHSGSECDNIAEIDEFYRRQVEIVTEVYLRCINKSTGKIIDDIVARVNNNR
jgi:chromosomal replication initiation ATPase DnaA